MAQEFIDENLFVGKQILIDSDRLVFNGRGDSIFSSNDLMLFKTNGEFHINTSKDTFINTKKIYIGPVVDGQLPNIPAVKSNELITILSDLISSLRTFFSVSYPQTSPAPTGNFAINKPLSETIVFNLNRIEQKLDSIKSDKVFIK